MPLQVAICRNSKWRCDVSKIPPLQDGATQICEKKLSLFCWSRADCVKSDVHIELAPLCIHLCLSQSTSPLIAIAQSFPLGSKLATTTWWRQNMRPWLWVAYLSLLFWEVLICLSKKKLGFAYDACSCFNLGLTWSTFPPISCSSQFACLVSSHQVECLV